MRDFNEIPLPDAHVQLISLRTRLLEIVLRLIVQAIQPIPEVIHPRPSLAPGRLRRSRQLLRNPLQIQIRRTVRLDLEVVPLLRLLRALAVEINAPETIPHGQRCRKQFS